MPVPEPTAVPVPEPTEVPVPELTDRATGCESAFEMARPVVPELVDEDWAVTGPEAPLSAVGATWTVAAPPPPPEAVPTAADRGPDAIGVTTPPSPPEPPVTSTETTLVASPVAPDTATEVARAPLLATLVAWPTATAGPLLGEPSFDGVETCWPKVLVTPASPDPPFSPALAAGGRSTRFMSAAAQTMVATPTSRLPDPTMTASRSRIPLRLSTS